MVPESASGPGLQAQLLRAVVLFVRCVPGLTAVPAGWLPCAAKKGRAVCMQPGLDYCQRIRLPAAAAALDR